MITGRTIFTLLKTKVLHSFHLQFATFIHISFIFKNTPFLCHFFSALHMNNINKRVKRCYFNRWRQFTTPMFAITLCRSRVFRHGCILFSAWIECYGWIISFHNIRISSTVLRRRFNHFIFHFYVGNRSYSKPLTTGKWYYPLSHVHFSSSRVT